MTSNIHDNEDYLDLTTKRDIVYNDVYMGYFVDLKNDLYEEDVFPEISCVYIISLIHRIDRRIDMVNELKK